MKRKTLQAMTHNLHNELIESMTVKRIIIFFCISMKQKPDIFEHRPEPGYNPE